MQSGTFKSGLTWSYNNRVFVVEGTGTLNEQEYLDITSKYDVGAVVIGKNVIIPMITDGDNKVCLFIDREAYPDFCNSYLYTYADSDLENKLHKVVEYCEKIDIPFKNIHSLHHLHASLLIFEGVDVVAVSSDMGHSVVGTTLNLYSHMFQEARARNCDAITNALNFADTN